MAIMLVVLVLAVVAVGVVAAAIIVVEAAGLQEVLISVDGADGCIATVVPAGFEPAAGEVALVVVRCDVTDTIAAELALEAITLMDVQVGGIGTPDIIIGLGLPVKGLPV
uniref:Secreted protein n=1 Tax=Ditylenchus dipsaci TaxID=166011 RepID=A0A915CZI1_9BILA